jgi:hypothetical protein
MHEDQKGVFLKLLSENAPELVSKEVSVRAIGGLVDFIGQFFLYGSAIGAFSGLWKVIELWVKRYANVSVKIHYKADDGTDVDIEYNNLTKKEAEKHFLANNPKLEKPVKVLLIGENKKQP